jgi:hypothetical protein
MHKDKTENITDGKRFEHRSATLRDYRLEIKFVGEPIYQFRLINVTNEGASILIKDDSAFLNMIEVGQIVDATFISPKGSNPSGIYKVQVKHISKIEETIYKDHLLVGISLLKKLDQD